MEINGPLLITLGILLVLLFLFVSALLRSPQMNGVQKQKILKQLDDIKYSMALHSTAANRDGIVRLDSLLSKVMQQVFDNSLKFVDNAKKIKKRLPKKLYEDLRFYHRMRNEIVHDNIEIKNEHAIACYKVYSEIIMKLLK